MVTLYTIYFRYRARRVYNYTVTERTVLVGGHGSKADYEKTQKD